jgi:hypothetical protein
MLPIGIESLGVRDLSVGRARIDLEFQRIGRDVVAIPANKIEGGIQVLAHL